MATIKAMLLSGSMSDAKDPARIRSIATENPDLPISFIRDLLVAQQEESIDFEFDEV